MGVGVGHWAGQLGKQGLYCTVTCEEQSQIKNLKLIMKFKLDF